VLLGGRQDRVESVEDIAQAHSGKEIIRNSPLALCIIVENMSVPRDPRVWREAVTLTDAGYRVSVICPKSREFPRSYEVLDGVEIYRHSRWEAKGLIGYLLEYTWALAMELFLAVKVFVRSRFQILQACNPPDTIFLIALFFKLMGVRFIFDQHDPAPEFFQARFHGRNLLYRLVCLAERFTFRTAAVALVTNQSCKEIATGRGGVKPENCFIVRNCPDLKKFPPQMGRPELKQGRPNLVIYVGVMGSQDGIDLLVSSIDYLINKMHRTDAFFVLLGDGAERRPQETRVRKLGLDKWVKFTGPLYGNDLRSYLASADIGVSPDPSNVFNDKLTMIKIFEFMAYGLPVVLFDLIEGRRSAGDAALYAANNDPVSFAEQIAMLLDSESLRRTLGAIGRKRVETGLNWDIEKQALLQAYETAVRGLRPRTEVGPQSPAGAAERKVPV